ncbi:hypothetical protein K439DRAFT_1620794 [Ramaria rubella]|nr:hypothetical protein K439DRAFT_1620794 [Ramaria rubella]
MSSQEDLATIIQEQSDTVAETYVIVAAFAYDTLLTYPTEVRFIWHKKFRLGTMLYLFARYSALLQFLLNVYLYFATFPSLQTYNRTCNSVLYFTQAFDLLPIIGVQGLLFSRAYAISSHKKLVFMMLTLLGMITIVLAIVGTAINNCITLSNIVVLSKTFNPIFKNRVYSLCFSENP